MTWPPWIDGSPVTPKEIEHDGNKKSAESIPVILLDHEKTVTPISLLAQDTIIQTQRHRSDSDD